MKVSELLSQLSEPWVGGVVRWLQESGEYIEGALVRHNFCRELWFESITVDRIVQLARNLGHVVVDLELDLGAGEAIAECWKLQPCCTLAGADIANEEGVLCSRVVRLRDLRDFHINKDDSYVDDAPEESSALNVIWDRIVEGEMEAVGLSGEISGPGDFFWVTQSCYIDELRAAVPENEFANCVRDALGLVKKARVRLVEVVIPAEHLPNLKTPTLFDAGDNILFRRVDSPDGWGRAMRLDDLREGAPEAVHEKIGWSHDFHVLPIGKVTRQRYILTEETLRKILDMHRSQFDESKVVEDS